MVDLKLTAKGIAVRKKMYEDINLRNAKIENAERDEDKAFDRVLLSLESDALQNFFGRMHSQFSVFGEQIANYQKLFLVFTLPLEGQVWEYLNHNNIKRISDNTNASLVLGYSYMPIFGEIQSTWHMEKGATVAVEKGKYPNSRTFENSIDLDPYIDFLKVPIYGKYDGKDGEGYERITDNGFWFLPEEVNEVILKVEDIIVEVAKERDFITTEELNKIIGEKLENKQGRVRSKKE